MTVKAACTPSTLIMAADVARSHGLRGALTWQVCPSLARISHAAILKPGVRARKRSFIVNSPRAFFQQAVQVKCFEMKLMQYTPFAAA